jgi:hypothetical protein
MLDELQDIIAELVRPDDDPRPIPAATVRKWMSTTDPEVRGATSSLLYVYRHYRRITPPLDFDEAFDWLLQYWEFCLRSNPKGEHVDGRWSAGNDMMFWFVGLWDEGADRKYFERIKALLANLYVTGQRNLKVCIEQAVVEHLFEREEIREFFADWKDHPRLGPAYEAGLEWALGGGNVLALVQNNVPQFPPSSFEQIFGQQLHSFEYCVRNEPKPKWMDMKCSGGWDLPRWFVRLWDEGRDRKYFESIKALLESLYPTGRRRRKACIEQAVLGSLFEREPIRELFESWKSDARLRPAYEAALQWARHEGSTEVSE